MNKNSNSTTKSGGSALEKPKSVNDDSGEEEEDLSFSAIDKRLEALLARVNELDRTLTKFSEGSDFENNDDEVENNKSPRAEVIEAVDGLNQKTN